MRMSVMRRRAGVVLLLALLACATSAWAAPIDLNGGDTYIVGTTSVTTPNALDAYAFDVTGANGDNNLDEIGQGGGLLTRAPISHIIIDGVSPNSYRIDYRNDNDFRNGDAGLRAKGFATSLDGLPGLNQNDNFATMFRGEILIPDLLGGGTPYNVEFGTNRSDDPMQVYLDYNQNGVFEAPAGDAEGDGPGNERVVSRNCCGNRFNTISIAPGTYNYMAVQLERSGGSGIEPTIDLTPDAHGRLTVEPGDTTHGPERTGLFQSTVTTPTGLPEDVYVDGMGNAIQIDAAIDTSVDFNSLTFDADPPPAGNELSFTGGSGKNVSFTTMVLGGGPNTLNLNSNTVTLSGAVSGSGDLSLAGGGKLRLGTAGTQTGALTIGSGVTVEIANGDALGVSGGGTVVSNGAQLRLGVNNITVNGNEAIHISGQGPGNTGAIYAQAGGNMNIDGPVALDANSRIYVAPGASARLRLRGGLALGGNQLIANTAGSGERLEITAPITGSGEIRKEGNGRIEAKIASPGYSGQVRVTNGYVEAWATDALGTGQIIAESDGTLLLRNGVTLPNNIVISTDGEGTSGAIRNENNTNTITGTVRSTNNASRIHLQSGQLNLTNTLTLQNNVNLYGNGTLNVTGQVTGGGALNQNDSGTLVLSGNNSYSGATTAAGTLRVMSSNGLGTTAGGTTIKNGATLELQGGIAVPAEALTLGTDAGTGTLANLGGANSYAGAVTLGGTTATIDNQAGSLALGGTIDMGLSNLTVSGAGDTTIQGAVSGTNTATAVYLNGLLAGSHSNSNWKDVANPGNLGVSAVGPEGMIRDGRLGDIRENHWRAPKADGGSGPGNTALIYTGEVYLTPGLWTFVEQNDDNTVVRVGGTKILDAGSWNNADRGSFTATLDDGSGGAWYDFEARFQNGGGGYGFSGQQCCGDVNWNNIGNSDTDPDGISGFRFTAGDPGNENAFLYNDALDPGDGSLFRYGMPASPNDLIKTGGGTLTLNGNNTYVGITDIQAGTVLVNGTTSGQGSYIVHAGATLGGTGTIGLAPGASIDILDDGTIAPGTSVGTLSAIGELMMDGVYAWELSATGGDLVYGAGPDDTLTLNDWILQLQDAGGDSYGWQKHYLFTGFENVTDPNDWTIDTSQVPDWARFSALWDLSIGSDTEGVYLTGLTTVPEPATMGLLALGALALVRRRRR